MDSFHLSDRTPEDFGSQWNHAVLSPSNSTGNPRESHEDSPSAAFSIQTPNHPTNHTHHHALRNGLGSEMVSNIESVLMTPSFVRPSSSGGSTSGGVGGVGIPWSHQVMGGGHLMESLSMPERSEEEQTQAMLRIMMLDEPISQNEINSFHSTIADGSSHVLQHTSNHTEVSGYASSGSAPHRPQNPSQTSMRRSGSSPTDLNQPTAHIASYFQNILREERESVHMSTPPVAHYTGMSNVTSPETCIDRLTELAYSTKPILFVYPILEGSSCREFDISGQATRRFGVFHGQRICKPYNDFCALTGTIVGVGSDGALWWHRDGDAAAIRLALLPEHMTKHGMPKVIGAAILGRAEQMVQNSAPYFPISNNGIHGDCHE